MGELALDALNLDISAIFLLFVTVCAFLIPIVIILPPVRLQTSDALLQTHSKAGLEPKKSSLKTHLSASECSPRGGQPPKIQSLMIYPIKSCPGFEVTKAKVLPQGLEFDRLFTFAQLKSPFPVAMDSKDSEKGSHKWESITQRQFSQLATVTVELWLPDEMKLRKQSLKSTEVFIILRFPWKELGWRGVMETIASKLTKGLRGIPEREVLIPVDFPCDDEIKEREYTFEDVRVGTQTVNALNLEKELPEELRLYLGVSNKLALFRVDPAGLGEARRRVLKKTAAGNQPVAASRDAVHLMNLSSLHSFNSQVPRGQNLEQLSVFKFRPNIVVFGAPEYDEESWKQVRFQQGTSGLYNDVLFRISCSTSRGKVPNIDAENEFRHPVEPDKLLRKLRNVDEGTPLKACLGMQATPLFDEGLNEEDMEAWIGEGMTIQVGP